MIHMPRQHAGTFIYAMPIEELRDHTRPPLQRRDRSCRRFFFARRAYFIIAIASPCRNMPASRYIIRHHSPGRAAAPGEFRAIAVST